MKGRRKKQEVSDALARRRKIEPVRGQAETAYRLSKRGLLQRAISNGRVAAPYSSNISKSRGEVMSNINQKQLKELLNYDPNTGVFTWLVTRSGPTVAESIAGGKHAHGYRRIMVQGKHYLEHRLVWLYVYGTFPKNGIDHINGNRSDNRVSNLRDVSQSVNGQNTKIRINNTSGTMGIYWCKKSRKWYAQINVKRKRINLGYFTSKREAIDVRKSAEVKHNYHTNHGRK